MERRTLQKRIIFLTILLLTYTAAEAQLKKMPYRFPNAGEYIVLKADLHMHTVFSDGVVWPITRVEEAYAEDLDVITLTEHIEVRPHLTDISTTDHNRSYEIAKDAAQRYGIMLIRSTEITRGMTPGHLNIIDIQDANKFEAFVNKDNSSDSTGVTEALREGRRQGGFIFWNHPFFPTPDNKATWYPAHQRLVQQGLMMGIEVANGNRYDPIVFQWCLDHNLTIIATSDVHNTMAQKRAEDGFKVMTLVLAHDKTPQAVMDALRDHRTVGLWNNQLIGRKEHVEPVIQGAIKAILHDRDGLLLFEFVNESGFPFTFLQVNTIPEGFNIRRDVDIDIPIVINPYETVSFSSRRGIIPSSLNLKALNVWTTPSENPVISIPVEYIKH